MRQASSDVNYKVIQDWKTAYEESLGQYERLRGGYEDLNREKIRLKNMRLSARIDFEEMIREEERNIMNREKEHYSKTIQRVEEGLLGEERNRRQIQNKHEDIEITLSSKRNDLLVATIK